MPSTPSVHLVYKHYRSTQYSFGLVVYRTQLGVIAHKVRHYAKQAPSTYHIMPWCWHTYSCFFNSVEHEGLHLQTGIYTCQWTSALRDI